MRKIVYDVAVSLDGYIAGPDSDISMFPLEGEHVVDYRKRLETYDTVIMGRRTYEFGYRFGLEPGRRAYPHMEHLIFSTSLELPAEGEVTVVTENWVENLKALKSSSGGDIYLCGGGAFAAFGGGKSDRLVGAESGAGGDRWRNQTFWFIGPARPFSPAKPETLSRRCRGAGV